jgi:hypothetical protein
LDFFAARFSFTLRPGFFVLVFFGDLSAIVRSFQDGRFSPIVAS